MRAKSAAKPADTGSAATATAEKPAAKVPTAPARPVEVFSPDRPASDTRATGLGPLMDDGQDPDDSGIDLIHPEPKPAPEPVGAVGANGAIGADRPAEKAISAAPAAEVEGPQLGEVMDLIEKLRTHVDAQHGRFEHAMGVLDQIRTSAAALPEIRERIDTMLASLDDLRENHAQGHAKVERALAAQSARLDAIAQAIERATQREERLSESLLEINQTIRAVTGTNDRLANAIEAMRRHEAERDARIGRALTGAQRWLMVLSLVMGLGMLATIITAVVVGG